MKNKNTTLLGIGGLLAIAGAVLKVLFDGDPSTVIEFEQYLTEFLLAIGLIFSRDAKPSDPVVTKTPSGTVLVEQAPTVPPSAV